MAQSPIPRPFLKWAGGKTRLLPELVRRLPSAFAAYHEPFLGSGALFFALHRLGRLGRVFLSDLNPELIDAYRAVRDQVETFIALLAGYPYDHAFYYALRARDSASLDLPSRAARTIYLNKTGYNGLYRVNRAGQFNVPFGRYTSPTICDARNLRAVSRALQDHGVELACAPFAAVIERAGPGDLVCFDPPYAPLSRTASFTAYYAARFAAEEQARLRDVCLDLAARGVWDLVSNSDTELIHSLYASPPFALHEVQAGRAINSGADRRGKIGELIITNYLRP